MGLLLSWKPSPARVVRPPFVLVSALAYWSIWALSLNLVRGARPADFRAAALITSPLSP